jgi:hypothetical protein
MSTLNILDAATATVVPEVVCDLQNLVSLLQPGVDILQIQQDTHKHGWGAHHQGTVGHQSCAQSQLAAVSLCKQFLHLWQIQQFEACSSIEYRTDTRHMHCVCNLDTRPSK